MLTTGALVSRNDAQMTVTRSGSRTNWLPCQGAPQASGEREPGEPKRGEHMLVLTRKNNESIMIGDEIEVRVLSISRDKIRIGITAPKHVPVFRKEVYISIKEEGADADGNGNGGLPSEISDALGGIGQAEAAKTE